MNNKVLILGLASPQADAIACCKSLGLEVHACADREAGLHLANPDYFAPIDIKDAEAICRYARDHQIRVIYSAGSDLALPTISYAGARLGLPHFVDLATVNLCSNKDQLRSFLGSDLLGNVRYLSVHSADEIGSWDIFPCVVKPVDSQGQRGFAVVTGREQLKNHLQRSLHYSPAGRAIIEEYIDGPEISVNLYLHEGRIAFAQTTDRIVFAQYPGIVRAHRIPSRVAGRKTEALVRRLCEALVQKLGLENGPLYIQLKLKDGEPRLIELTPRLDGCHLWQLIKFYCGVNLLEVTFRHLLGEKVKLERSDTFTPYTLTYITAKPGATVEKKQYRDLKAQYVQWYYEEGDTVHLVNGIRERVAHYIEKG